MLINLTTGSLDKQSPDLTMRYHLMPVRMDIVKMTSDSKRWCGCGEKGTLVHSW